MAWKESRIVDERMKFVIRSRNGERMVDLCREFGISRKTGYKFVERFERLGPEGLVDQSRAPITQGKRISPQMEKRVLEIKDRFSTWGARKIHERLAKAGISNPPSAATVHRVLVRHGHVQSPKKRRTQASFVSTRTRQSSEPNQIWAMDFKGQFTTQDRQLCYPLTVTDHFSRYLLLCEGLSGTTSLPVERALKLLFEECGLPAAFLSDNGCPFGSGGIYGLSRLSIWLMRLGIEVLRIEPGHPEQNGRHERMHLTLKRSVTRPSASNLLQQQEWFDRFKEEFNHERPHEALGMKTPSQVWKESHRKMPSVLPTPDYTGHDLQREVYEGGLVLFKKGVKFALGKAFAGQPVALTEQDDRIWSVNFMNYELGILDEKTGAFRPHEFLTLSPM